MLTEILKYQELEQKLLNLEQKVNSSNAKQLVTKMSAIIKDEQNKLRILGEEAAATLRQYDENKKKCDELNAEIKKIISLPLDNVDEKTFKELSDKAAVASNNLEIFQRNLSINNKNADNIAATFNVVKKRITDARVSGSKAKEELNKLMAESEPEKHKLTVELAAIEKSINKDILARYKRTRGDNIFPVFVPLNNSSCGGCRMQVSASFVNKVKENGYLECEQCRRLVYIK